MIQRFDIPGRMLGRNERERLARTHWRKANDAKQEETDMVAMHAKAAKLERVKVPSEVVIIYHELAQFYKNGNLKPLRDVDNVSDAQKPILDGLVRAGVLPDDNPYWVRRVIPSVKYVRENPRITVTVMDYEPYRIVYYQPVTVPESECR